MSRVLVSRRRLLSIASCKNGANNHDIVHMCIIFVSSTCAEREHRCGQEGLFGIVFCGRPLGANGLRNDLGDIVDKVIVTILICHLNRLSMR